MLLRGEGPISQNQGKHRWHRPWCVKPFVTANAGPFSGNTFWDLWSSSLELWQQPITKTEVFLMGTCGYEWLQGWDLDAKNWYRNTWCARRRSVSPKQNSATPQPHPWAHVSRLVTTRHQTVCNLHKWTIQVRSDDPEEEILSVSHLESRQLPSLSIHQSNGSITC